MGCVGRKSSTITDTFSLGLVAMVTIVTGCQPTENPTIPESVRQQLNDRTVVVPRPADGPRSSDPPNAPSTDVAPSPSVRRFAVRPFEEWTMRETAAAALGRIGKSAVPRLTEALQSPNASLRHQAADTLARIGPGASEAVPALIQALRDEDPLVRKAAARALGQIGPDASDAVPPLIEMLIENDASSANP